LHGIREAIGTMLCEAAPERSGAIRSRVLPFSAIKQLPEPNEVANYIARGMVHDWTTGASRLKGEIADQDAF